ncbi:MAG TPA: TonB-dependent receptor, partial [Kofleriaceae bacterium]|nr:TonB-dependent receptor [Kofleriaceae bacterium]
GGILDTTEQRFSARLGATQRIPKTFGGSHEIKGGIDLEDNRLHNVRDISGGVYYQNLYDNQLAAYDQIYSIRWIRLAPPTHCQDDPSPGDGTPEGTCRENPGQSCDIDLDCAGSQFDQVCTDAGMFSSTDLACQYLDRDPVVGETLNWAGFLQDSWQPIPNLTVNYGMRYEEQRLRYAKALQGTEDPFTGVPRGKNAMLLTGMFAPRLGAVYDWTKEGRSKIYGHWGRFYEAIPMNINNRSFGGEVTYQQVYSLGQCGPAVPGFGGPGGPGCETGMADLGQTIYGAGTLVAPGIKAQYLDEYIVGTEYEVLEDLKLGVSYQDRRLGRILEDVSVDNADTYIIANPGEVPQGEIDSLKDKLAALQADPDADPIDIAVLANQIDQFEKIRIFDKPRRDYTALQLTAIKRFSRHFFAQGSYTYSRTKGNFQGLFSSANGQVDPNITSQFDLIELTANQDGPLPQDRPHYVKIDSYYVWDFKRAGELTTGLRFRALSGTPRNALGHHYLYGFSESFLLPRGSMGRNPFDAGLDLHVGFRRLLTRGMELEVFTDLFNVFNRQTTADVDENFTTDSANPIVGGSYSDLVFAKQLGFSDGGETADPVTRWPNFMNRTAGYAPLYVQLGARLTF